MKALKFAKDLINNKELNKFFFIFKYVFLIFFLSISIYLIVPKFFNYQERTVFIKKSIFKHYKINLNNQNKISYNIFPTPRLNIFQANLEFNNLVNADAKKLTLVLPFTQLYRYENLYPKKLFIDGLDFSFEIKKFKNFIKFILNSKNFISIKESKIFFKKKDETIAVLKDVDFNNKNPTNLVLRALVFGKKISVSYVTVIDKKILNIKFSEVGSEITVNFDKDSTFEKSKGNVKAKILNNNLKFNFLKTDKITISNSFLRHKVFQTSFNGMIVTKPYFDIDLILNLKNLNFKKISRNNLTDDLMNFLEINKKLNGKYNIKIDRKKISYDLIKEANIFLQSENGNIFFKDSNVSFDFGDILFDGNLKNKQGFHQLNFNTNFKLKDKKKFLKLLGIKRKIKDKSELYIRLMGTINLSLNKIYIKEVILNKEEKFNEEDILYYKKAFENLVIKDDVFEIFNIRKIRQFILEII
jgi:hypothetical protein